MPTNVIIISGFAGSGKSTLSEGLARKLGWNCVHASDILRQIKEKKMEAIDLNHTKPGLGYWESDQAMQYNHERLKHLDWDKLVNEKLYEIAKKGNVVFDSWSLPWVYQHGFKVWLKVSLDERTKRLAERDGLEFNDAKKRIAEKENQTIQIFKKAFGFEFGKDLLPFHTVIDTTQLEAEEVLQTVWAVTPLFLKKLE